VNWHDRGRPLAQYGFHRLRCQAPRIAIDVGKDGAAPSVHRGLRGRIERHGGHDDLVAGLNPERSQGNRDRVGAVADAHGVCNVEVIGKLRLECLALRAQDIAPGRQDSMHPLLDPRKQRVDSTAGGEEGDLHGAGR
jgi:hypothetical protein